MGLQRLPLVSIQKMVDPYCSTSRLCMITTHRLRKNLTSRPGILSPSLLLQRTAGGVASFWTRRGDSPDDTYSRATSFVCSDLFFASSLPSNPCDRVISCYMYAMPFLRFTHSFFNFHGDFVPTLDLTYSPPFFSSIMAFLSILHASQECSVIFFAAAFQNFQCTGLRGGRAAT